MDASKTSALIAGATVAATGTVVEANNLPFFLVALVFFPSGLVFVIGFEIWREWAKGEHISGFPIGPKDKEGWAIYGRAGLRMIIWFIGAGITGLALSAWQNL
ncbi:hypothetical protein [Alcanivorax hongdengensis]|uniref:hypothetical protein n=1 Tax=Alcanivorax hongdengensis TaxID=519051 RepID=UPI0012F900BB|nr:hypothetical protein [Alcanivorax hongdengensis]